MLRYINTRIPVTRMDESLWNSSWSWLKRNGFWYSPDLPYISNSHVNSICEVWSHSESPSMVYEKQNTPFMAIFQTNITNNNNNNHFMALCPGLPRWAGTRRNIHPLTPILIINHPLSVTSIYYDPKHPPCSIYVLASLFAPPHFVSSLLNLLIWNLHFILHTFLHLIIVFFSQHMPIPSRPVLL